MLPESKAPGDMASRVSSLPQAAFLLSTIERDFVRAETRLHFYSAADLVLPTFPDISEMDSLIRCLHSNARRLGANRH
jgi:hypothetical protein